MSSVLFCPRRSFSRARRSATTNYSVGASVAPANRLGGTSGVSGDDRHRRVAHGLDALGQHEVTHANRSAHREPRDIDLDEVRNLVGTGAHFDAEHLLVDFPVGVTHFDRVTDDVQRHLGDDGRLGSTT